MSNNNSNQSPTIAYSEMPIAQGEVCYPCREYKGMMECPECGVVICIFCTDGCDEHGLIDWSA